MNESILLLIVCLALIFTWGVTNREREKQFQAERDKWEKERKDLMDRIQAPSFNEYASKVIREKKAEQPEDPQPEIEFIS